MIRRQAFDWVEEAGKGRQRGAFCQMPDMDLRAVLCICRRFRSRCAGQIFENVQSMFDFQLSTGPQMPDFTISERGILTFES